MSAASHIEWRAPGGTWVRAREPRYDPDGSVRRQTPRARWAMIVARKKNQIIEPARLVAEDGTVLATANMEGRDA